MFIYAAAGIIFIYVAGIAGFVAWRCRRTPFELTLAQIQALPEADVAPMTDAEYIARRGECV